jgi:hypothetical protein
MPKLETIAAAVLKKTGGDVEKALPEFVRSVRAEKLIDDLARAYLRTVAASGSGQSALETHRDRAGPAPKSPPMTPANGSITVTKHPVREHKRRTHEEKQAARQAMLASADAVFEIEINGRAIGGIAIGELSAMKRDLFDDAVHKLMLGTQDARNAVLAELIEQHCQVPDQLARVRDVIDAKTLERFVAQSEQEAPRRIAEAMRYAAAVLEKKEIAS